eukprot:RCo021479
MACIAPPSTLYLHLPLSLCSAELMSLSLSLASLSLSQRNCLSAASWFLFISATAQSLATLPLGHGRIWFPSPFLFTFPVSLCVCLILLRSSITLCTLPTTSRF